ncbi:cell division protein FtsW [Brevibacillus reuszeri]|uniref:Cell division protein FtsW n=1 Tax=Brevibacillus reuszeri TaxID=54915 RepID=A0A0K9YIB0_9BACL|nr:FtsW/RodA/SpoVE family cell cycle protein [Brevibacillus reuszeri]KNB68412.1 hypothetical protein ADS79_33565 [Brevibacillus reuszeri]MED1861093.1 FtsW/RodA/SpoVE family cell cycle protein [Brevibacillus reuszeri]GED72013.1 cell division protein FtsW [Brevibacillus reuszeri]
MKTKEKINHYIQLVCKQIRNKEVHPSITLELENHIADKIEDFRSIGMGEKESVEKAIAAMGDPTTLGRQLHQAHKPRMEWGIFGLAAALIGFGLFSMYSINISRDEGGLLERQLIGVLLGSVAFIAILFADYTKLKRYSKHLYLLTLLLMLYTWLTGTAVNGEPQFMLGSSRINIFAIAPFLLIVSLAGILSEWNWKALYSFMKIVAIFALPLLVLLGGNNTFSLLLYLVGSLVLILTSKAYRRIILSFLAISIPIVASLFYFSMSHHHWERLHSFLDPYADPNGRGYVLVQSMKALSSAGLWGNGFGSPLDALPDIESDFIFTYLVYSFGLVAGAALVLIGVILFARLLRATKLVKDRYGFLLLSGWMALFFTPFFWSIFMTIGLVPPTSATLPFVSNGIVHLVLQMALIGLVLNVYRRKDIMQLTKQ